MIADDTGKSSEIFIKLLDGAESANMHVFTISQRVSHIAEPLKEIQKRVGGITEELSAHAALLQELIDEEYNN